MDHRKSLVLFHDGDMDHLVLCNVYIQHTDGLRSLLPMPRGKGKDTVTQENEAPFSGMIPIGIDRMEYLKKTKIRREEWQEREE